MQKLKHLLENVHKWPVKCENHECFLPHEFPVIRYSFEPFDLPLDVPLVREINQRYVHGLCIPVDSFDLRCYICICVCNAV